MLSLDNQMFRRLFTTQITASAQVIKTKVPPCLECKYFMVEEKRCTHKLTTTTSLIDGRENYDYAANVRNDKCGYNPKYFESILNKLEIQLTTDKQSKRIENNKVLFTSLLFAPLIYLTSIHGENGIYLVIDFMVFYRSCGKSVVLDDNLIQCENRITNINKYYNC